jgi:predicted RNase H-like HicB family nuclease
MFKYHLDIYWSEDDNAFIAAVPELPGCMADGATYEEVIKNIQVVIQEWIEVSREFDRSIPDPVYGCISAKGLLVPKTDIFYVHDGQLVLMQDVKEIISKKLKNEIKTINRNIAVVSSRRAELSA